MKTFNFNNIGGQICPICGTDESKDATLVPIAGTEEGNNAEAAQVHTSCLTQNMWLYPKRESIPSMIVAPCEYPYKKQNIAQEIIDKM